MIDPNNRYSSMQKKQYEYEASYWSLSNRDPVVGSFDQHNNWKDYDTFLFKDILNLSEKIVLDFGCGPGRNLVKFNNFFKRMDGIDISQNNIDKAKLYLKHNQISEYNLFTTNGTDLIKILNDQYDIVMSTICFQHICIWEIRFNLLQEIYRVIKPNGFITLQMGFGPRTEVNSVDYYNNFYEAQATNSCMDTRVEDSNQIKKDLEKIGFINFNCYIRPTGPGDTHPNWIFFNAQKV